MRIFKVFVFSVWTIVATSCLLIALEAGARFFSVKSDSPLEKKQAYAGYEWSNNYFKDYSNYSSKVISRKQYTPYSLWREDPYTSNTINITSEGIRKTTQYSEKTADTITVFMFGGSTLFSAQVPDAHTIPSLVAKQLHSSNPEGSYHIVNYGFDGYVSDQEVILLTRLLLDEKQPDIVIFYDGANDIFHKSIAQIPHSFYKRFEGALDRRIAVKELFYSVMGRSKLLQLLGTTPQIVYPHKKEEIAIRVKRALAAYEKNIDFVQKSLASNYNFTPLFFWQPLLTTTSKKLSAEEEQIKENLDPSISMAFEEAKKTLTGESFSTKQRFYNCTHCFDNIERSIFLDFCHVTAAGNEAIAHEMASRIKALE